MTMTQPLPLLPTDAEVGLDIGLREPTACGGCPLEAARRGFVPGAGLASARLVLIGEAPGREEIAAGVPFVGPSGRIIRRGLDVVATYITNVRKCLPPEDETPDVRAASIAHCVAAYLQPELDALGDVRAVHAVGGDAARVVAGVRSITEAHGSVFTAAEAAAMRGAGE